MDSNCADSKLVPSWHVGRRDAVAAMTFIKDLASRLSHRVQLTTDGHRPYLQAVEEVFGSEIDYAMLVKIYGNVQDETRYSPAKFSGSLKVLAVILIRFMFLPATLKDRT